MAGLRRITLNYNMLIGDRGATHLAGYLEEDLWLKGMGICMWTEEFITAKAMWYPFWEHRTFTLNFCIISEDKFLMLNKEFQTAFPFLWHEFELQHDHLTFNVKTQFTFSDIHRPLFYITCLKSLSFLLWCPFSSHTECLSSFTTSYSGYK